MAAFKVGDVVEIDTADAIVSYFTDEFFEKDLADNTDFTRKMLRFDGFKAEVAGIYPSLLSPSSRVLLRPLSDRPDGFERASFFWSASSLVKIESD